MLDTRPALHLAVGRLSRRTGLTPTGIDRFEQAYLHRFAGDPRWRLDPVTPALLGFRSRPDLLPDAASGSARPNVAAGDVFMQCSHSDLDRPGRFRGFAAALRVFHVHDVIPIEDPEYCRDGEADRHRRRLETLRAVADLVIVNSRHTAERLRAVTGEDFAPVRVVPPGVEAVFTIRDQRAAPSAPEFVVLSSVEARKNVPLLLALWQRLGDRLGEAAPRLVLIGADGLEAGDITRAIEASPVLGRLVERVSGIGDEAVAERLRGARALLAPSLAEGYGLSIAEALAVGTPVVASDIPSHREVGGPAVDYVAPLDGPGWLRAIEALIAESDDAQAGRRLALRSGNQVRRWPDHFADLDAVLAEVASARAMSPRRHNRRADA